MDNDAKINSGRTIRATSAAAITANVEMKSRLLSKSGVGGTAATPGCQTSLNAKFTKITLSSKPQISIIGKAQQQPPKQQAQPPQATLSKNYALFAKRQGFASKREFSKSHEVMFYINNKKIIIESLFILAFCFSISNLCSNLLLKKQKQKKNELNRFFYAFLFTD